MWQTVVNDNSPRVPLCQTPAATFGYAVPFLLASLTLPPALGILPGFPVAFPSWALIFPVSLCEAQLCFQ